jgi:hypothetical protein
MTQVKRLFNKLEENLFQDFSDFIASSKHAINPQQICYKTIEFL